MGVLELTGASLAREMTAIRDDGKQSTPATISRWMNGTSPVDPAVMLLLRERLLSAARTRLGNKATWPGGQKRIVIAVGHGKGGVGASCLAAALAIVAARDFGGKVFHAALESRGETNSDGVRHLLTSLRIRSCSITWPALKARLDGAAEENLMVVDLPRGLDPATEQFLGSAYPDVLVVPADFGCWHTVRSTCQFLDQLETTALVRLLHHPRLLTFDFISLAAEHGFDVASEPFVPFFFPLPLHDTFPGGMLREWEDRQHHRYCYQLLEYLLEQVGVSVEEPADPEELTFAQLVGLLERTK